MNNTRKNYNFRQNNKNIIQKTNIKNGIKYTLYGKLNTGILNKIINRSITRNNRNILKRDRELTFSRVYFENDYDTGILINSIKENHNNEKLLHGNIAYINLLMNKWDKNIKYSKNKGTYASINTKKEYFQNQNIGNIHPVTQSYFLRKGVGAILLKYIIKDLGENNIQTIILHASNKDLEKYYSKFGFNNFSEDIFTIKGVKYGDGEDGHIMYLHLP